MTKTLGGFTIPNYKVSITLGMVIVAGQIVRNESATSIILSTEQGVIRFIEECGSLVSLKVTNLINKKDVTEKFKQYARFVPSRYQGGVSYVDMRSI
jgi:hypothetical protein